MPQCETAKLPQDAVRVVDLLVEEQQVAENASVIHPYASHRVRLGQHRPVHQTSPRLISSLF